MFSSSRSRLALVTVAGAVVLAVSAPGASAATSRYVAPSGTGTDCSAAKPCNFEDAVKASGAGDEVVMTPGSYYQGNGLQSSAAISIHGVAGEPRPHIKLEFASLWLKNTTLRYVEVEQAHPTLAALSASESTIDQVVVKGPYFGDCALSVDNSTVRNSVVIARSDGSAVCAYAFQSYNATMVRNVTAVAGDGVAIDVGAVDSTANVTVSVRNTIAKAAGGFGLYVEGALGSHAKLTASNTNYANYRRVGDFGTVFADAGSNQSTPPLFVDAAKGDYRQKAGSVTIDAGAVDGLIGSFDLDGDPRSIGAPDIGADEFVPPPPPAGGQTPPPVPGGSGSGSGSGGSATGTGAGGTGTAGSGFAGVKLVSTALTLRRGFVTVKLSCPAASAGRCTGSTNLSARRKRSGSRAAATVRLARGRFSVAAGSRTTLKLRVSPAGRRLFAHTHRLRGRAANSARDAAGLSKTTSTRVTIRKGTR